MGFLGKYSERDFKILSILQNLNENLEHCIRRVHIFWYPVNIKQFEMYTSSINVKLVEILHVE